MRLGWYQVSNCSKQQPRLPTILLYLSAPLPLSYCPLSLLTREEVGTVTVGQLRYAVYSGQTPNTGTQELQLLSNICFSSSKGTVGTGQVPHLSTAYPQISVSQSACWEMAKVFRKGNKGTNKIVLKHFSLLGQVSGCNYWLKATSNNC